MPMKWQCQHHKRFIYFAPGYCLICHSRLEPVPTMPKVVQSIVSDPKLLNTALELANMLLKGVLRR